MTQAELINVFKYIVKKCDMLINNDDYEADAYTQDTVEDIAEVCNHILDEDYGKLVEVREVDFEKEIGEYLSTYWPKEKELHPFLGHIAKHFFELGLRSTITEEDCKLIWNIGDEIPNMSEEEFFKELLKRYKARKGE